MGFLKDSCTSSSSSVRLSFFLCPPVLSFPCHLAFVILSLCTSLYVVLSLGDLVSKLLPPSQASTLLRKHLHPFAGMSSINMPWSSSSDEVQPAPLPCEAEGIWPTARTDIQRGLGHSTSSEERAYLAKSMGEYTAASGKLRLLQATWLASWHDAQSSEPVVATESEPLLDRGSSSSARPPLKVRRKGRSKQRKAPAVAEELPVAADEAEAVSQEAAAAASDEARVVVSVKKKPATGAELQARRKQVACEGYSLSGRDFAHRRAVKTVCMDDALAPGTRSASSAARPSPRPWAAATSTSFASAPAPCTGTRTAGTLVSSPCRSVCGWRTR